MGAGLLVGTALAVILPEGVEALQPKHSHCMSLLYCFNCICLFTVVPHNHHKDTHIAKQILEESNEENDAAAHPPRIVPKDAEMHAEFVFVLLNLFLKMVFSVFQWMLMHMVMEIHKQKERSDKFMLNLIKVCVF